MFVLSKAQISNILHTSDPAMAPSSKFTYNQQNHLFLFKFVLLVFVFHPLPHNVPFLATLL